MKSIKNLAIRMIIISIAIIFYPNDLPGFDADGIETDINSHYSIY
jgi:hypothetical protein